MTMMTATSVEAVEQWIESLYCYSESAPVYWYGKGAWNMRLAGDADAVAALRVFRDGLWPHSKLATFDALPRQPLPASYFMLFRPHETVSALAALPELREAVLAAHREAVGAALDVLEERTLLGLIALWVTYYDSNGNDMCGVYLPPAPPPVLVSKVVFMASGGWMVWPSELKALETYQRRLGEELAQLLAVEVVYEPSPQTSLPVAVVQS